MSQKLWDMEEGRHGLVQMPARGVIHNVQEHHVPFSRVEEVQEELQKALSSAKAFLCCCKRGKEESVGNYSGSYGCLLDRVPLLAKRGH